MAGNSVPPLSQIESGERPTSNIGKR